MGISGIETNNALNSYYFSNTKRNETVNNSAKSDISDNFSESDETKKFKEIVSKYDITNISKNELDKMYQELFENKLYNPKIELVSTVYSTDAIHEPNTQPEYATVDGWTFSTDPTKKFNYLEGIKAQSDWNKENGDPNFQKFYDNNVEFVEKIRYIQLHT